MSNKNNSKNQKSNAVTLFFNNNAERIFRISCYAAFISGILFSLFSISFHADISLLAFPISAIFTAITIWFGYFKMIKNNSAKPANVFLRLAQYLPYVFLLSFIFRRAGNEGTYKWFDAFSVFFWLISFISSLVISHYMNPKKFIELTKHWAYPYEKPSKGHGLKFIVIEILEWIDALVQAVFFVFLLQIFFFQLYVIPSESMVSEFLVGDKVIVTKCHCGPKFPLTDIGFPTFTDYKRGDVVVLRNPKYTIDRKSEIQSVTSHLIYMLSFSTLQLNKDEDGNIKYDPLVKRICGEQGEQLVMLDGTLYARTKDNSEFTPQKIDSKYALWNIKSILPSLKQGERVNSEIMYLPYDKMIALEEQRRNLDLDKVEAEIKDMLTKIKKASTLDDSEFQKPDYNSYSMYRALDLIASDVLSTKAGFNWFNDFATSWCSTKNQKRDMYEEANYRWNVMFKYDMTKIFYEYANLIAQGNYFSDVIHHPQIVPYQSEFENLMDYILQNDQRNMPVFPKNLEKGDPDYIPKDCYFMMGDNRFNSEDLRHGKGYKLVSMTKDDPSSIQYYSNMDPVYINKSLIQGKPVYKFWPLNRTGKVRTR